MARKKISEAYLDLGYSDCPRGRIETKTIKLPKKQQDQPNFNEMVTHLSLAAAVSQGYWLCRCGHIESRDSEFKPFCKVCGKPMLWQPPI